MRVEEVILERIKREGPISFRDFMEMALYYPSAGYYTSDKHRIGKQGDYYTTPYVTPLLGELIGRQIEQMWHQTGKRSFTILEYGAGNGFLCNDILNQIKGNKDLYKNLYYYIIEKNGVAAQTELLSAHENVFRCNSIRHVSITNGCILSNELVDNFPVHQVIMEDELMEVYVDHDGDYLEILKPAGEPLKNYLRQLKVTLPRGFRAEINLDAVAWLKEIANALRKGFVITIDYGFPSVEMYSSKRRDGTLLCYHQHKINSSPYLNIGEQDITAHVNFSALHYWGGKFGLQYCSFSNQAQYLRSIGLTNHIREMEQSGRYNTMERTQKLSIINTLLLGLGGKLKVLVQQKGVSAESCTSTDLSIASRPNAALEY